MFLGRFSKLMHTIFHISKTFCVFPGVAMGVLHLGVSGEKSWRKMDKRIPMSRGNDHMVQLNTPLEI